MTMLASNIGHMAACFLEVFIVERLTSRHSALLAQRQPPAQDQQSVPRQEAPGS